MDLLEHLRFIMKGGAIMVPLLGSFLLSLVVVAERWLAFRRTRCSAAALLRAIERGLPETGPASTEAEPALERLARECEAAPGMVGRVLAEGLRRARKPMATVDAAMGAEAEERIPELERYLPVLDTVITLAPLLGLLGTITGIMGSFQVLSTSGVNQPTAITGGVAEALIATATGLVIAIVDLCFYNYFTTLVKARTQDTEAAANRLLVMLREWRGEPDVAARPAAETA